jgi:phenylpropionate dioxygenase-like ring-hydroxylating dioxygenase large terminal subunit
VGGPGQNAHSDIDRDTLGLIPVRFYVWMDTVFVNPSGKAPEFRDYAASLIKRCREFDGVMLHHGGPDSSFTLEVETNWKLAVENFAESYHLPWVHPGLNSYSRLENHYNIEEKIFCGQGSFAYAPPGFGANGERFSHFSGLSEKWDKGAEYPCFFPNTLFGFQNDHVFVIRIEPTAPDRTIEQIEFFYADKAMTGPAYAAMRKERTDSWKQIFIEDIMVVEGMQKGRSAPGFDGGKFSPVMDGPTHRFHAWVAEQLTA